jgi:hypothetical protein
MSDNRPAEKSMRFRFAPSIVAALVLAIGIGYGLSLVGTGLSARAGNAITVTGSARVDATADNAVWTLNVQESAPAVADAVKKVESGVTSLSKYLTVGGVPLTGIEVGAVNTATNDEYGKGGPTGRVLSYRANQNVVVRSEDVKLIQSESYCRLV